MEVLNLIINGLPSILVKTFFFHRFQTLQFVLNLIINGLPSIQKEIKFIEKPTESFKPYYKWITFNT